MSGMPVLRCEVFIHFLVSTPESDGIMVPFQKNLILSSTTESKRYYHLFHGLLINNILWSVGLERVLLHLISTWSW